MSDTVPLTVTVETLLALQTPTPETARKTRPDRATWQHKDACPGRGCPAQRDPAAHVQLTYVDSRYVQQVLDSEVGPANWQDEYQLGDGGKVACRIGIYVEDRGWVWKGDGAGATDIEGDKGSFSDAFKRAAVKWGIARDLYDEKPTTQGQAPATSAPAPTSISDAVPTAVVPRMPPGTVPYQELAAGGGDKCPTHGWTWSVQPGGTSRNNKAYAAFYKCGGKTDGKYCTEKPSEAWVAAHPIP